MSGTWLVIPVKGLEEGKSRLAFERPQVSKDRAVGSGIEEFGIDSAFFLVEKEEHFPRRCGAHKLALGQQGH